MIGDIIEAIGGKVKFCLSTGDKDFYFVSSSVKVDGSGDIEFTDVVDNTTISLDAEAVKQLTILTFGANTIPTHPDINAIKTGDNSFFETNKEDHDITNKAFDDKLTKINEYISQFGTGSSMRIKECVLENFTDELDKLKILGATRVVSFSHSTSPDRTYIRTLFQNLIDERLGKALLEIDQSMEGVDDEQFKADAEVIKEDLIQNVNDYWTHMKGVTFDKLFNQWPTLLNPSPFSGNGS